MDPTPSELLLMAKNLHSHSSLFLNTKCLKNESNTELLELNEESRDLLKEIDEYVIEYERGQEELLSLEFEEQKLASEYEAVKKESEKFNQNKNELDNYQKYVMRYGQLEKELLESKMKLFADQIKFTKNKEALENLKKLTSFEKSLISERITLDDNSSEMKIFYLSKMQEFLNSIKIEPNESDNSWQISFLMLTEDCLDSTDNPLINAKSVKRRKITKENACLTINSNDAQTIFENYNELLCTSLTKKEIEVARKYHPIDWLNGLNTCTILLNSSSKKAQIQLPKFYPFAGTSKIKLVSLTGYDEARVRDFKIDEDMDSLHSWVTRFIDMFNAKLINF